MSKDEIREDEIREDEITPEEIIAEEVTAEEVTAEEVTAEEVTPEEVAAEEVAVESEDGIISEDELKTSEDNEKPNANPPGFLRYLSTVIIASVLIAVAVYAGKNLLFSNDKKADLPVAYVKDDSLYIDNLKEEPYLAADTLSDGGSYSYYYTAWGVMTSADGKTLYYSDNVSEDGRFDLYKREAAKGDSESSAGDLLISSGVMNYQLSENGKTVAYLKATEDDNIGLYTYSDANKEKLITANAILSENSFQLSKDGSYIVYEQSKKEEITELAVQIASGGEEKLLTDALVQYSLAKATDKIYYVGQEEENYTIYEYSFGQEPVLVGKNAVAMEILGNDEDVLYCTQSSVQIKSSDILEDDMADADAAVPSPDIGLSSPEENKAYDEKAARDEVRLALADGTFESPMLDCFIWSDGKAITVDTEILNAKAAISKEGHVLYSKIDISALEKVKLSAVSSLDEAKYMYYVNLSGAPRNTYMAKAGSEKISLERDDIGVDSFTVSANGKRIAFDTVDALTGSSQFFTASLDSKGVLGEAAEIGKNVLMNEFAGEGETLYWLEPLQDSTQEGALWAYENGEKVNVSERVSGYRVAEDGLAAYFISDIDGQTGNGKLNVRENAATTEIDQNVFCLQYKGNGNIVYMKNYDMTTGVGELYYWDGKTTRLIDEGVSAIFIF